MGRLAAPFRFSSRFAAGNAGSLGFARDDRVGVGAFAELAVVEEAGELFPPVLVIPTEGRNPLFAGRFCAAVTPTTRLPGDLAKAASSHGVFEDEAAAGELSISA